MVYWLQGQATNNNMTIKKQGTTNVKKLNQFNKELRFRVKKLIFKFFYFFIFISDLYASDIFAHYEKIKNQIKTNKVVVSGDYYFTGSFAGYSAIESIDSEKNENECN